ncbi:general transcriptional corepressor trfA-like [Condylostylus longicornis]|uniref:general transcriptional corepressor trfA-like n=1 Tax=Condylostylus longicornis TaxID=2530218 RepID=UPI00244DC6FB|nr:general transcriptional corepressor trfA-like [Condylostylus longicornis]
MNLNNDISIGFINNNSNSSSIGSTNSSSCNSSSYCIENNSNSENVIQTTVNNDKKNFNHINNVIVTGGGIINSTNGIINSQQNLINFGNLMGKNIIINNSQQNGIFTSSTTNNNNGKNENQNFNLQQKVIDSTQKMPQIVTTQQQPKPLSANNFNFLINENSKNNYEFLSIQPPRPYRRKFSCVHENKVDCTPECDQDAGLKRDKKNEYARQQMRKYREKIKSDPVRYMKYLQTERERNAKRKFRKMEKLMKEDGVTNPEEILKLEKREKNRQYREKCRMGLPFPKFRTSTQQRLLKALIQKVQNGDYKLPENYTLPDVMLQQLQNIKTEETSCKEETLSDTENLIEQDDGITDSEENSQDFMDCSDDDSRSDDGFISPTYNRICAVVNCPSRFCNDDVEYFPLPSKKSIRDLWIRQIKVNCKQWEVNPNAFICSLHFSSTWFESSKYTERDFLLKAVPTIFPNASASQFDLEIPELDEKDFESMKCSKNFYKWSKDKMREQENLLKHQHSLLENQSEMNFLQKLKISKIINEINEFKSKYLFAEDVKKDLDNIFDQIRGISMNFPN